MDTLISKTNVLKLLNGLLEQAEDVLAKVGESPTAQEALNWAIGEVENMVTPTPDTALLLRHPTRRHPRARPSRG